MLKKAGLHCISGFFWPAISSRYQSGTNIVETGHDETNIVETGHNETNIVETGHDETNIVETGHAPSLHLYSVYQKFIIKKPNYGLIFAFMRVKLSFWISIE